jgi:peptidoglycan-associated lipoprotein
MPAMMLRLPSVLLLATLALAACNNPDRFGGGGGAGAGGAEGAGGLGSASDPASAAYFQTSVGDRVLFAVDQSSLSDQARGVLAGQAQWLTTNSNYAVIIEGHADERGTREYNLALGARRANAVREYLISQGISSGRIRTVSFGKERPVAVCSDESCYSQNRRAVTVITAGQS